MKGISKQSYTNSFNFAYKNWATKQSIANKPSSIEDFCKTNNICEHCKGLGCHFCGKPAVKLARVASSKKERKQRKWNKRKGLQGRSKMKGE